MTVEEEPEVNREGETKEAENPHMKEAPKGSDPRGDSVVLFLMAFREPQRHSPNDEEEHQGTQSGIADERKGGRFAAHRQSLGKPERTGVDAAEDRGGKPCPKLSDTPARASGVGMGMKNMLYPLSDDE